MRWSARFGYDAKDKKLVINEPEAKTVRYIYRRYLDLKCLRRLKTDLGDKGIVTKHRVSSSRQRAGGVRFTYGPLAYLLKNRTYLGEIGHDGSWFPGEHKPVIDPALFDAVQNLLSTNAVTRRQRRTENQSLLTGLLFDDRGNRMAASFSTKRGVRYRFYVSSALLDGRKDEAGSVTRVSAPDLEAHVLSAVRERISPDTITDHGLIAERVERVVLTQAKVLIMLKAGDATDSLIELPQPTRPSPIRARIETGNCESEGQPDPALIDAIVRSHSWLTTILMKTFRSREAGTMITEAGTTTLDDAYSAVSWKAILAGAVAAAALTLVMVAFGVGVGFSVVSPWANQGVSSTTFTIAAGITG